MNDAQAKELLASEWNDETAKQLMNRWAGGEQFTFPEAGSERDELDRKRNLVGHLIDLRDDLLSPGVRASLQFFDDDLRSRRSQLEGEQRDADDEALPD